MRILLPIIYHSLTECIARAFTDAGHEVRVVDWAQCADPDAAIRAAAESFRPDLAFMQFQRGGKVSTGTCDIMRNNGAVVFNWSGDVREPLPKWYVELGPHVNATLFTNWPDVLEMRSHGMKSDFLQVGYEQRIYCYEGPKMDCPPIVFLGNNYGAGRFPNSQQRIDMVEALRKEFGKDFAVYGNGWGSRHLNPKEEAAVYRSCKVAIHQDHFTREGFFSDRWLRIGGCGAPALYWMEATIDLAKGELLRPTTEADRLARSQRLAKAETWDARIPEIMRLMETYR